MRCCYKLFIYSVMMTWSWRYLTCVNFLLFFRNHLLLNYYYHLINILLALLKNSWELHPMIEPSKHFKEAGNHFQHFQQPPPYFDGCIIATIYQVMLQYWYHIKCSAIGKPIMVICLWHNRLPEQQYNLLKKNP